MPLSRRTWVGYALTRNLLTWRN